ncbi:MAG: hypothetical protein NC099_01270 [Corallococcus sp.]|nr:hypothetical protein [Corallococcus sp.]
MKYCEHCSELMEQEVCPKCGNATREPQDNDLCFVSEMGDWSRSMFSDALNNNDIEFVSVPVFGGFNPYNTPVSYKFYVKYADYNSASEILDVLFFAKEEQLDDEELIDRIVRVTIDRPLGSRHPSHPDVKYELNYGHVEGVMGGDGEEQDAYIIDYKIPMFVGQQVSGWIVAVIRRKDDSETKWVVDMGSNKRFTRDEIARAVDFQEKFFDIEIIM